MKGPVKLSLAVALALACSNAFALGLGTIQVKSGLNQPLVAEIPVTGRSEFRKALARSIGEVFAGSQTPKAGLQQAGRDWRAIVERIGAEKVRDNYRLSLGLSPLSKRN